MADCPRNLLLPLPALASGRAFFERPFGMPAPVGRTTLKGFS